MLRGLTSERMDMTRVTILLFNCSFENIFFQRIDYNVSFLIDYIYSGIYLI